MTDNVHWNSTGSGRNWTDPAPGEPGIDSYYVDPSGEVVLTPGGSEPTNDIYMVFKPGCSGSELLLIDESAGYDNRIFINGQVAIDNTNSVSGGTVLSAPGVNCPSG